MSTEGIRLDAWIDDELQRRADVEEEPKIQCYGCARDFYEEDLTQEIFIGCVHHYCDDCTE